VAFSDFILCIPMTSAYRAVVKYSNCETKTNLLLTWQTATDGYTRAVSALSHGIGAISSDEYDRLCLAVENARERSKEARNDFQAHVEQHHCMLDQGEPN
jgi:hypothetical protein